MRTISITDNEAELITSALVSLINKYSEIAEDYYEEGLDEIAALFEKDCNKITDIIKKFHVEQ